MNKVVAVLGLVLFFASCEPEEERLPGRGSNGATSAQVEMGTTYINQVYFDLGTGQAVANRIKLDWDLGFSTSDNDNLIVLNGSKLMKVANTGTTDFADVTKTTDYDFFADYPTGYSGRNAIGQWQNSDGSSKNEVYVVDRGFDDLGNMLGFIKMQIVSIVNDTYTIRFADMDGTNEQTATIVKDSKKNYVNFSFDTPTLFLAHEPDNDTWDFVFTQYTELLQEGQDSVNYLVTGVLSNTNGVEVALEKNKTFSEVTYEYALTLDMNARRNAIGYDWKIFDFGASIFYIEPNWTYIIKDTNGDLYKLQFTDFYSDLGEKGSPAFDFQLL